MANPIEHGAAAAQSNSFRQQPDEHGHFGGRYGGRFVAETLMPLILELNAAYEAAKADPAFHKELAYYQTDYIGRPSRCGLPAA